MSLSLLKCGYGTKYAEGNAIEDCCLRTDGSAPVYERCPVFDWKECEFRKKVKGCGTCAHATAMTLDVDGGRMVECEMNELQMYAPYATECKHWEKARDES